MAEGSTEIVVNALETNRKMAAQDLQESTLTTFLEGRIQQRLERAYQETADNQGIALEDVEKCPTLSLRLVSAYEKMHVVRDGVQGRYKHKNYPTEFPCRTKCLVLFQKIDGQDVILFGMYVYEYGHKCPNPNQRRVYISYLDSVHYFRPKQYRTVVYHEIIISYLEYVKARGFHTAHIWACPPLKGDDYILYVHPQDQKTPKDDKLRKWYQDLLAVCKDRGIVTELSDIFAEYLADHSLDATVLPYFEGDYWVNEAEVIIKDLRLDDGEPGGGGEDEVDGDDGPSKSKNKSKRKGQAARPTRASRGSAGLVGKSERDPVMAKLASIIEPMKEAFFVARLWPKEYVDACSAMRLDEMAPEATKKAEQDKEKEKMLQEEGLMGSTSSSALASKVGAPGAAAAGTGTGTGTGTAIAGETGPTDGNDVKIKDETKSSESEEKESSSTSAAVKMEVVEDSKAVEEKKEDQEGEASKEKEEVEEEETKAKETTTPARNSRKNASAQPARKSTRGRSAETPEKGEKEAAAGGVVVDVKDEPTSTSKSKSEQSKSDQSKNEMEVETKEASPTKGAAAIPPAVVDVVMKEEEKEKEAEEAVAVKGEVVKEEPVVNAAAAAEADATKMDVETTDGATTAAASSSSSSSSSSSASSSSSSSSSAGDDTNASAAAAVVPPPETVTVKPTMLPLLFSPADVFELKTPGTMKHEIMTGVLQSSLTKPIRNVAQTLVLILT